MKLIDELYHGSFQHKLLMAHQLYEDNGKALSSNSFVQSSLDALELQAQVLQEQMSFMNFATLCSSCALKSGGGCCSLFMADENDAVLFLINLLAGYEVTIQKDDNFECYLLGPRGCTLRFKPMFCLNYNCHAVKIQTDNDYLSSYLTASALLLQRQWHLESLILAYLRTLANKRTGAA